MQPDRASTGGTGGLSQESSPEDENDAAPATKKEPKDILRHAEAMSYPADADPKAHEIFYGAMFLVVMIIAVLLIVNGFSKAVAKMTQHGPGEIANVAGLAAVSVLFGTLVAYFIIGVLSTLTETFISHGYFMMLKPLTSAAILAVLAHQYVAAAVCVSVAVGAIFVACTRGSRAALSGKVAVVAKNIGWGTTALFVHLLFGVALSTLTTLLLLSVAFGGVDLTELYFRLPFLAFAYYWATSVLWCLTYVTGCGTVSRRYFVDPRGDPAGAAVRQALGQSFGSICLATLFWIPLSLAQVVGCCSGTNSGAILTCCFGSCLEDSHANYGAAALAHITIDGVDYCTASKRATERQSSGLKWAELNVVSTLLSSWAVISSCSAFLALHLAPLPYSSADAAKLFPACAALTACTLVLTFGFVEGGSIGVVESWARNPALLSHMDPTLDGLLNKCILWQHLSD